MGRRQVIGATIVGELTADRQTIILIADGPDYAVAEAARRLQMMTPLIRSTGDPGTPEAGAMRLPATWAAVVQLSETYGAEWRPGPALSAWIGEQVTARAAAEDGAGELLVAPPAGLVPRSYQVAGAYMIGLVGAVLLSDEPGPQPVTTPILTPSGWSTLGALATGDVVFDRYGRPARVRTVKHFGEQPVYRVRCNDRTSTLATAEHRWRVYSPNDRKRGTAGRVLSTAQLVGRRWFLPQQPVIRGLGDGAELPLDPYTYGALLGDGTLGGEHLSLTSPDDYVIERVHRGASALDTTARREPDGTRCGGLVFHRTGKLRAALDELDARHGAAGKAVHPRYLVADECTRRAVLAGLLDTDGSVDDGAGVEFSSASPQLAADVAFLARSLGAVVTEARPARAWYRNATGRRVECHPTHRVLARFPADGPTPFALPRKAGRWSALAEHVQRRNPPRIVEAVDPAGTADVCCIELDTDDEHARVYLSDTALIPTHNTGKTVSTVLGAVERAARGHEVLPLVVVCPSAVVDSWVEHFHTWAPQWRAVAWRGSPARRRKLAGTADVYVTTYGIASRDAGEADRRKSPLLALNPAGVVVDECHKIKAQATEQSKAVRRLTDAAHKRSGPGGPLCVPLSGTPITHHPGDLWPALYAMCPDAWPSRERWVGRYCDTVPGEYAATVLGLNDAREPEYRTTVLGQHRRVAKADVLAELPPKVYSVRTVDIPPKWRKAYDAMEGDMLADLPGVEDGDGGETAGSALSAMTVLAQLTRLAQLASSAADVESWIETVDDPETGLPIEKVHQKVTLRAPSWKVDEALDVMAERPGTRFIVAAPSRQLVVLAGEAATKAGYRVGYVVGGQTAAERTGNVAAFQAGELDLICVTTGAGGVGLTLTAASCLIFLQRPWSLVEALQMEDRAHRIGSERHDCIEIVDVVARKTIDTRVRAILRQRAGALSKMVEDPRIVRELLGGAGGRDDDTTGEAAGTLDRARTEGGLDEPAPADDRVELPDGDDAPPAVAA